MVSDMGDVIKLDMVNMKGKSSGDVELSPAVFAAKVNRDLVYQTVRWQRAKRRAGTHSVLNRAKMKGGGQKPFKQKGTGRARAGSRNSPLWVGGAVTHGPSPRSYDFRLPSRTRRQALCSVLTSKVGSQQVVVLDKLEVKEGKTRELSEVMKNLGLTGKKVVVLTAEKDEMIWRSGKNIQRLLPLSVAGANVYDLLNAQCIVATKEALEGLQQRLTKTKDES